MRLFYILLLPLCLLFTQVGPALVWPQWAPTSRRGHRPQAAGIDLRQRAQTSDGGHRPQAAGIDLGQRAQTSGSWHRPQTEGTDLRQLA
ncbi:hypothetical protein QTO34_016443 [Cnephaeus nilssonii]|uniref:Uncharacterized protein n=1 Tax=Cnephaeus nilssonii TaxID=3371016 RepID=A0AA40I2B2_CNENI|nr:hypothetical protein QTO34_016443 [Eptesicus nilssonii]